mmetsp:Transcript_3480/g.7588  ORF Transcript_3480/g.7588 Transcript_3480/m.7588 type:complete len:229 (-) Transcript_3480:104-790(-)
MRFTFAMGDPDAEGRARHAFEQNGRRLQDGDGTETRLEAARGVVDEPRLLGDVEVRLGLVARAGDPPQQCHELAAVTDTEREGVLTTVKSVELSSQLLFKLEDGRPPLCGIEHVGVREATDEDDPAEPIQRHSAANEIRHRYIPRFQPASVQGCRHLAVAVGSLLPQNRDAGARADRNHRRFRCETQRPRGRRARAQTRSLLADASHSRLQLLQLSAGRLPNVPQVRH